MVQALKSISIYIYIYIYVYEHRVHPGRNLRHIVTHSNCMETAIASTYEYAYRDGIKHIHIVRLFVQACAEHAAKE